MNVVLAAVVNGALLGALVVVAVWFALRAAPRRVLNAATRYVLWWVVLAIAIALPVSFLPLQRGPHAGPLNPARIVLPRPTEALPPARIARPAQLPLPMWQLPPAAGKAPVAWPSFPIRIGAAGWPRWIFCAWLAVSLILLARLAASCVLLQRVCSRAADVPAPLRARAGQWAALCGASRRGIRLAISAEIVVPVAVGPRRPSILIPAALLDRLRDDELEQLGLHEAAHMGRGDDCALLAERALEALFALHPVVRWITRQIDLEREIACDDLVIAATGRPRSYATCLTRVVELSGGLGASLVAAAAAEDRSHLARRIEMLLDKTRHTGTRLLKARLSAALVAVAVVAWAAGRSPALVAFPKPFARALAGLPARMLPKLPMMAQAAQPPDNELAGQVVEDSSNNPLASAELCFHQRGMRELAADLETDRQGRFRTTELPPGDYTVDLSKPNYITTTFKLRAPAAGLLLRLVRYGAIDGSVMDMAGHAIPGHIRAPGGRTIGGARLTVLAQAPGTEELRSFRQTAVEDSGHYRVYDLPPGQYAIGLWYSGLNEGSGMQLYPDNVHPRIFTVSGGEDYSGIDFTVEPRQPYSVSGRIEPPAGKRQFQVALGLPEQPALPIAQTLAEDDGTFRFEKVLPGAYDLFVAGPTGGYGEFDSTMGRDEPLFGRARVQVIAQNVEGINVPLSTGRPLKLVLRPQGSDTLPPGCPATVSVLLVSLEPWAVMFAPNAQVAFGQEQTIRNLAPGRFRVTTSGLGAGCYQVNQPVVDLSGDAAKPVAVELAAAGSIRGLLKSASAPATDFAVMLLDAGSTDGAQAQLAFPDRDGRFTFDGLRPGRYRMAARRAGADASRTVEVDVRGGAPTVVELPAETKGDRP
jgi:beta-lactamase regulating signal transducer with metallopeptidase domain